MDKKVEAVRILEAEQIVHLQDRVSTFVAADFFEQNTSSNARVKIAEMNDEFLSEFLPKIEHDVDPADIRVFGLKKTASDSTIIGILGGKHEMALCDLSKLLRMQPFGESGALQNDGKGNLFYIKSQAGTAWAIQAKWLAYKHGWQINAYSINQALPWGSGRRIFSR